MKSDSAPRSPTPVNPPAQCHRPRSARSSPPSGYLLLSLSFPASFKGFFFLIAAIGMMVGYYVGFRVSKAKSKVPLWLPIVLGLACFALGWVGEAASTFRACQSVTHCPSVAPNPTISTSGCAPDLTISSIGSQSREPARMGQSFRMTEPARALILLPRTMLIVAAPGRTGYIDFFRGSCRDSPSYWKCRDCHSIRSSCADRIPRVSRPLSIGCDGKSAPRADPRSGCSGTRRNAGRAFSGQQG